MNPEDTADTTHQFKLLEVRPRVNQRINSNPRSRRIWDPGVFPTHITEPNQNQSTCVDELQSSPYLPGMRIMMAQYFEV